MGSFGNFLENETLDQLFGGLDYAEPATVYIALSTADPTDDGSGLAEPVGGGYARKAMDNDKTTWSAAAGGALSNAVAITFAQATGDWGTITHFAIMDAVVAGNMLTHGSLATAKAIEDGDTAEFKISKLGITLD